MRVIREGRRREKMQGMWVSLENINCGKKLRDVIHHPKKPIKETQDNIAVHIGDNTMANMGNCKECAPPSCFKGDPSRNVIEKILEAALRSPMKKNTKITRVLQVKNSEEIMEKFEKYRDTVQQKAKERMHNHARSLVDGNELLCYYVTTMTCQRKQSKWVTGNCEDSNCKLCSIIRSSFDMEYTKRFGIQLSRSSEALSESIAAVSKGKNVKRGVIICRIIAGRIQSVKDKRGEDDYDSVRNKGFSLNSEYLIVNNPDAVLPCFVIVLN